MNEFDDELGVSINIGQYELRMKHITLLLLRTKYPIPEVADLFDNHSPYPNMADI
jgi:hypothetical protein